MIEIKAAGMIEKMADAEIIAEYKVVEARLEEIEHIIDPALQTEIDALRDYETTLKATMLARTYDWFSLNSCWRGGRS